ncbi:glycosyl transferase family 2 [Tamlana nanhaiensis]|uniref:Glycosyl transferase family 2 n=1 Tax=Neotamlana nanhaiensis TaxID=1382798 RepID=A0A0D7W102_9FLAO|nr:glycosyltransferase [Tamlana nanhaiensis]KJD31532.1 glycosyl transferase family 2 [Tamlana nanhaiensis]
MNFSIIIPAHNEQDVIGLTLDSLVNQTYKPKQLVVVNDNSSDDTETIVKAYCEKHEWISLINHKSSQIHSPGTKVINAFYKGFNSLNSDFDIICKFDADIILPNNYLERINAIFKNNPNVGIAGGLAFIKKDNAWVYENIANKTHVRGPFKAYRKACFNAIGGLKPSIGWDTVDTLLAKYHGWDVKTDQSLRIKHLKPTGANYNKTSKYLQGEAMYKMRYGFTITAIAALKIAYKKRSITVLLNYVLGYFKALNEKPAFLVNKEEGKFIRNLRWKGILKKLG